MRNDLTAPFLAAMASTHRTPIQLVVFHFTAHGDICLSDRDVTVDGILYEGLVEDWGALLTSGGEDSVSGTMETSLSIWNGGAFPFSQYFETEDPINTFVDFYQTFDGLAPADRALIGNFVIQDPLEYSETSRLLIIDLVTTNMRYFGKVGEVMARENFPNALESDINKTIDLIVGNCTGILAVCSNTPPRTIQSGSILSRPTRLTAIDDLDEKLFASFGYVQVDAEIMYYDSKDTGNFNITIRGYGASIATDHSDGSEIIQAKVDVEYLLGLGPINSISNVKVNGQTPTVPYTVHPGEKYAVVRFQEQPTFTEYSRGARVTDSEFDATNTDNTAFQPHYAYDNNFKSFGALLSKNYRKLSVLQTDSPEDDGEVVRVFLAVDHWATELYANDNVAVNVDGIGNIGYLAKPNPRDIIDIQAEIDLDHGHNHVIGGIHDHPFVNPAIATNDPSHLHDSSVAGSTFVDGSRADGHGLPYKVFTYGRRQHMDIDFANIPNTVSRTLKISFLNTGSNSVSVGSGTFEVSWDSPYSVTDQIFNIPANASIVRIGIGEGGVVGGYFELRVAIITSQIAGDIDYNYSGVNAALTTVGNVNNGVVDTTGVYIKDSADVLSLAESNRQLENIVTLNPSKSIKEKFDLTKHLETVDWDWLTNRKVSLSYVGSTNTAKVIVTRLWFEVEYRQKQVRTTDIVTADLIGSIESRPDAVIQYLLTQKAFVPSSKLGSVIRDTPKWDDLVIWDDMNIWQDGGQVSDVPPDALFEEAGAWFAFHGYTIDGTVKGDSTIKDAIQKITFQTRSAIYWQNGIVTLVIKRKSEDWINARNLTTDKIRLRSLTARRSKVDEIYNDIAIFYDLDRLSTAPGSGAYRSSINRIDNPSVLRNGQKRDDDLFLFDLVRAPSMAESIVDYYIWYAGDTKTRYGFDTYLSNFDIEKGEYVSINSSGFANLTRIPVNITDIKRIFGSGKNNQINLLAMIGESIRHYNLLKALEDGIEVNDNLSINLGFDYTFSDGVNTSDYLLIAQGKFFEDTTLINDVFSSIMEFKEHIPESLVLAEDQKFDINIGINVGNTVLVQSSLRVTQELCFGACGFGAPNCIGVFFGSPTDLHSWADEYQELTDELSTGIEPNIIDDIIISDNLVFSDGFGCPTGLGDGFGLSPFGC
jgi:hypothetical protein